MARRVAAAHRGGRAAIRVAVAGSGYVSQFDWDGWRRLPEIALVGVASLDPAARAAAAARVPIPQELSDVGAMLEATAPTSSTS